MRRERRWIRRRIRSKGRNDGKEHDDGRCGWSRAHGHGRSGDGDGGKTNRAEEPHLPSTPILVRKDFADLLKWSGAIQTDADGHAEIPLEFPDNLTTWKARVWVLGKGTQVGEGSAEIITSKELLVRLQAPRFLVERDEAVLQRGGSQRPRRAEDGQGFARTRWQQPRSHRRRAADRGNRRPLGSPRRLAGESAARRRGDVPHARRCR